MPDLGETAGEQVAMITLQIFGSLIPISGLSAISGLLQQKISGRRQKLLEAYAEALCNKVDSLEQLCRSRSTRLNLVEEGFHYAYRGYSPERIEHIASVVANGISGEEKEEAEASRMLKILAELGDDQIIVLAYHLDKNMDNESFYKAHANVLEPKIDYIGGGIKRSD